MDLRNLSGFLNDIIRRQRAFSASDIWYDTVAAELIAAILDLQDAAAVIFKMIDWKLFKDRCAEIVQHCNFLMILQILIYICGNVFLVAAADDNICILQQTVIELGIASSSDFDRMGMLAYCLMQLLAALGSSHVGHCTGKDQHRINIILFLRPLPAFLDQCLRDALCFICIDFAA